MVSQDPKGKCPPMLLLKKDKLLKEGLLNNSTMNEEHNLKPKPDGIDISADERNLTSVGFFSHSNESQVNQTETESEEESEMSSILEEGAKRTKEVLANYIVPRKVDYGNKDTRTQGEKFGDGEMPPYQD